MPAKDPTELESETCNPRQESALVNLPIPSHEASLTLPSRSKKLKKSPNPKFQVTHIPS